MASRTDAPPLADDRCSGDTDLADPATWCPYLSTNDPRQCTSAEPFRRAGTRSSAASPLETSRLGLRPGRRRRRVSHESLGRSARRVETATAGAVRLCLFFKCQQRLMHMWLAPLERTGARAVGQMTRRAKGFALGGEGRGRSKRCDPLTRPVRKQPHLTSEQSPSSHNFTASHFTALTAPEWAQPAMSSPPPASPGPSQAHSPPPSQPSPPSSGKEHVTTNDERTPVQLKPTNQQQQQPVHAQQQYQWPQRPQLPQLTQPHPHHAQASSPLARPGQFPHLTQGQEPDWSPASPPSSQHGAVYIPQPWSHQFLPSYPPVYAPSQHGPPTQPAHFSPHQQQASPTSAHPQQSSPAQYSPLQQSWFGQQSAQPGPGYSPYVGLPAGGGPGRSHQPWPASAARTEVDPVRSSYPPAPGLSALGVQPGGPGSPVGPTGAGLKRNAAGAPLSPQYSHPTFTPINPPGLSQSPQEPAPTKKAKVDKVQRSEYYNVTTLANATPFITKLKFILDNPDEFGEAVRWE